MLALIVSFRGALNWPGSRLALLIQSLRAQLMPSSFKARSSIEATNQMLISSPEAIYVFQYLALMRQPVGDYLNNMLNLVFSHSDSLVPIHVLRTQAKSSESALEVLFEKIGKSEEKDFLAAMLDQLNAVNQEGAPFLSAVLLFILAIGKCSHVPSVATATGTFIFNQIQKLAAVENASFDCQSNLSLLAFLRLASLCRPEPVPELR